MVRASVQLDDEMFCWDVVPTWERSFGIRFRPDDFAQATTVGDIWAVVEQHIIARVGPNPPGLGISCATQRTFYRLRRALMGQGFARSEVLPCRQLRDLFPWRKRRRLWRELQQSGLPLPLLRMPRMLSTAVWVVGTAMYWGIAPNWGMAVGAGLATAVVVSNLPGMQWEFPVETLGELTVDVVAINYRTLSHPYLRNSLGELRDIVLAGLARCGAESTEVAPDELYDGTKLAWS